MYIEQVEINIQVCWSTGFVVDKVLTLVCKGGSEFVATLYSNPLHRVLQYWQDMFIIIGTGPDKASFILFVGALRCQCLHRYSRCVYPNRNCLLLYLILMQAKDGYFILTYFTVVTFGQVCM